MKNQYLKDLLFLFSGILTMPSYLWNRLKYFFYRPPNIFLNIGCGHQYIKGMINIDANPFCKKEIWLDVSLGLPFADNAVLGIYAHHFLEHFNIDNIREILSEFYRVLKIGGAARIVVPSFELAIKVYLDGDISLFSDWPVNFKSRGGRINNFLLCSNQHFTMFDFSLLAELLSDAGFKRILQSTAQNSEYFKQNQLLFEPANRGSDLCLYVEAHKL